MKQHLSAALLSVAGLASAQLVDAGPYNNVSPNGAFAIRIRDAHAVMRGARLDGVLRKFYPTQITRELDLGTDITVFLSDHKIDGEGNVYATGLYRVFGSPSLQFVVKLDAGLNILWYQTFTPTPGVACEGTVLDIDPNDAYVVAGFQTQNRTTVGFTMFQSDGAYRGRYRHGIRAGRVAANAKYVQATGTQFLFGTEEETSDNESYINFTVVDSEFRSVRRVENRPATGRGATGRRAGWRLNHVLAPEFNAFGRIYYVAQDTFASGAESVSRLSALQPVTIGSSLSFGEDWFQKDTVAFRGPRFSTRLANVNDRVFWMGRYDRPGATGPGAHPALVNAYNGLSGARAWYRSLTDTSDVTAFEQDQRTGDLVGDTDGLLRAYMMIKDPSGVDRVRAYTISPDTGFNRSIVLNPGFYNRPPYDTRGSIGLLPSGQVAIGLSNGWLTANLPY